MNERIRELFLQAGFHPPVVKRMGDEYKFEKFAELIVRSCIEAAGDPADGLIKGNTWHDGVRASIWSIKQEFGIQE